MRVVMNPLDRRLTETEVEELVRREQPAGMIAGVEPLTRSVMQSAPELRVISRCGVGLDSVDLEAAGSLGIRVYNTPRAPMDSVAELTLGMMLCLLRKITVLDRRLREGRWGKEKGYLLRGKTVGIVGCGTIGTRVAELVCAFGCEALGCDPRVKEHPICRMVGLDELLADADVVSVHVPLVEDTRGMFGAVRLAQMKHDAVLVNTSRGGVVVERDLAEALRSGTIAGAALDVFEEEPYAGELLDLTDRTILTPHVASSAAEARRRMEQEAAANLVRGLKECGVMEERASV